MAEKVFVRTTAEGEDIYAWINPATGKPIKPNEPVNGTRNRPVSYKPTNPLIETSSKAAGMTQCDSEVVVCPGYPSDGLKIGDFYSNEFGQEFQIIGIGADGNPLTGEGRKGKPDYNKAPFVEEEDEDVEETE